MEMEQLKENQQYRPTLLTVLLVLTYIGSGLSFFANTFIYVLFDPLKAYFLKNPVLDWMGTKLDFSFFPNLQPAFFLLQGLLAAMALAGALYMWKLKKVGFHLYTLSQLILLIIPKLFIPDAPFPLQQLAISGLFVYLYYNHLKLMR